MFPETMYTRAEQSTPHRASHQTRNLGRLLGGSKYQENLSQKASSCAQADQAGGHPRLPSGPLRPDQLRRPLPSRGLCRNPLLQLQLTASATRVRHRRLAERLRHHLLLLRLRQENQSIAFFTISWDKRVGN
jgi:hypothetical protein